MTNGKMHEISYNLRLCLWLQLSRWLFSLQFCEPPTAELCCRNFIWNHRKMMQIIDHDQNAKNWHFIPKDHGDGFWHMIHTSAIYSPCCRHWVLSEAGTKRNSTDEMASIFAHEPLIGCNRRLVILFEK